MSPAREEILSPASKKSKSKKKEPEEEEYVVEKVVDKRTKQGRTQYFVKWKGWSENRNSVVGKINAAVEMDEDAAVVVVAWSP